MFLLQNSSIFPPEENVITLQSSFFVESSTVKVSAVLPDTLVSKLENATFSIAPTKANMDAREMRKAEPTPFDLSKLSL